MFDCGNNYFLQDCAVTVLKELLDTQRSEYGTTSIILSPWQGYPTW